MFWFAKAEALEQNFASVPLAAGVSSCQKTVAIERERMREHGKQRVKQPSRVPLAYVCLLHSATELRI